MPVTASLRAHQFRTNEKFLSAFSLSSAGVWPLGGGIRRLSEKVDVLFISACVASERSAEYINRGGPLICEYLLYGPPVASNRARLERI